jgi:signal transduction histidine kinase
MRWRFVWAAMAAVFAVMLVLVATINLINYSIVTARQDQTLSTILQLETKNGMPANRVPFPGKGWLDAPSPETQYSTRFFVVHCDRNGNVLGIRRDYIASVSEAEASEYAANILARNSSSGYSGDYRYTVEYGDKDIYIVFLNSANELQLVQYMLLISGAVAAVTFLLIFGLVILLSKHAISPYVKNLEMQKQFITDAGHEIKTPLTSIATSADVLAVEHEGDEWVENIQKQSVRLTKLVNNLVTLSRLDESTPFPEKTRFSLSEAAWETSEPFSSLAKANGKNYNQQIVDNLEITGDKNAIQQMISILLDNALRYTNAGGQIQFDVYRKSNRTYIEVFNTCEPISQEDIAHLFDRFYRPDKSRSKHTGGTGIGLSIAKATAEGHGGKITAKSPSGNSIRFVVTL